MSGFFVYSGRGFMVPVIAFAAYVVFALACNAIMGSGYIIHHVKAQYMGVGFMSVVVWLYGRLLRKPRHFVDIESGAYLEIRPKHTLYLLRVEYWSILVAVVGTLMVRFGV